MSKEIHEKVIILALTALLTGCPIASITADHVTQPVMLGNIKRIDGSGSDNGQLKSHFDISVEKSFSSNSGPGKADAELLKLIGSSEDEVEVKVKEIYFGSYNFLIGMCAAVACVGDAENKSWAGIAGGIYREEAVEHDKR